MNQGFEHTDVAAYALGILNDRDRRAFEAHLSGCRFCTAELADLRGMRTLLTGVEPPPRTTFPSIPARRAAPKKSFRHRLVSVAAGLVLVLGGAAGGVALSSAREPVTGIEVAAGEQRSAVDSVTGTKGTVALDARTWGTSVALELSNVTGPFACELVVVTKSGTERVAGGWTVPARGYGVPGSPDPLKVEGSIADPVGKIDRLEVRADTGKTILVIPV